jgi:hypothetical protein
MTVKVMKADGWNGELHTTVHIEPGGSETIYFNETGNYFTKRFFRVQDMISS